MERKLNAREARTRLKNYEGAANIAYNMVRAWRTLVSAQERMPDQYAWEEKMEGGISLECMICNSITKNAGAYCPSLQHKVMVMGEVNTLKY